jgi:hypothetical protein
MVMAEQTGIVNDDQRTDITKRLRELAYDAEPLSASEPFCVMIAAADEIERLRETLDGERKSRDADAICYDSIEGSHSLARFRISHCYASSSRGTKKP